MSELSLYRRIRPCLLPVLLTALSTIGFAQGQSLSGAALVNALRQGGCVLVMRHASSPAALPDKAAADPQNLGRERQLDEVGRDSARAMGQAIRVLKIPVTQVLSSPTYRARETVRLAGLGTPEVVTELDAGGQHSMQAAADEPRAAWLRHRVTLVPPKGANTLIVTHAPNILGAFGQSAANLSDGETLVFRPDGKGSAALLARIKIEEWPQLARADSAHGSPP